MNFSAPNITPSPSRYPTANDSGAPADVAAPAAAKGEFDQLFAGVTQRGAPVERGNKGSPSSPREQDTAAAGDKGADASRSQFQKSASHRGNTAARKSRSASDDAKEPVAPGQIAPEIPAQNANLPAPAMGLPVQGLDLSGQPAAAAGCLGGFVSEVPMITTVGGSLPATSAVSLNGPAVPNATGDIVAGNTKTSMLPIVGIAKERPSPTSPSAAAISCKADPDLESRATPSVDAAAIPLPSASATGKPIADVQIGDGRLNPAEKAPTVPVLRADNAPSDDVVAAPQAVAAVISNVAAAGPRGAEQSKSVEGLSTTNPVVRVAADFAATAPKDFSSRISGKQPGVKNFLVNTDKELASHETLVGTNVAKPSAEMPTASLPRETESLFSKDMAVHAMVESASQTQTHGAASSGAPARTETGGAEIAQRAVDAVMEVSERFTSASQRAVNLQFSFGGGDLSVRVEMREGQVHATFHTDSAELRTALTHEWQSVTGGERSQRFADPVFAGSSSSSIGNHGDAQGQSRGQGQDARQPAARFELSPSRNPSTGAAESPLVSAAPSRPAMPATALRLHTFA